jgi:integrase
MQLPSRLRLSRHGVWCFRLVLPEVLANAIGQKEIRKSLGTRCPIAAKLLAYRLSGKILPIVREAKKAMGFDPNSIDPKSVRELIVTGLVIDRKAGTLRAEYIETSSDPEIAAREFAALWGNAQDTPPQQTSNAEAKSNARPPCDNPCTIADAIKAFLEHKGDLAAGSRTTYTYRLNLFASLVGGPKKILNKVTNQNCVKAKEDFCARPPHMTQRGEGKEDQGKEDQGKEVQGKEVQAKEVQAKISASTVKDTLTLWQSFFDWAIGTNRYAGDNPITTIPRPKKNNAQRGAVEFRPNELAKIFQPQNFATMKRPHQFWGPLFALFTGARSNEIAQLRLSDFIEENGIRCIRIAHDPKAGTQTKNAASNRVLPLHPTLWEIGLKDYLEDLKSIGADRLFPNLPKDAHGKREKYLSRDFNENLLGKLELRQARVRVFHSFRDTVAGTLAKANVHAVYISDWLGHARQGTEGEHYLNALSVAEQMRIVVPVLDFKLDFSGFKYEPARWNDWLKKNSVP